MRLIDTNSPVCTQNRCRAGRRTGWRLRALGACVSDTRTERPAGLAPHRLTVVCTRLTLSPTEIEPQRRPSGPELTVPADRSRHDRCARSGRRSGPPGQIRQPASSRPGRASRQGCELEEPSWVRARVVFAALIRIRATAPMITRSSSIWRLTIIRDVSVLGVMSPNPTVEKTVIVK